MIIIARSCSFLRARLALFFSIVGHDQTQAVQSTVLLLGTTNSQGIKLWAQLICSPVVSPLRSQKVNRGAEFQNTTYSRITDSYN